MARRNLPLIEIAPPGYEHRPLVLDLFCGAGGASKGWVDAGYRVIGVDTSPLMLKRYPWESHLADAVRVLEDLVRFGRSSRIGVKLSDIAVIHASPPCEAYSATFRIGNSNAEQLIAPVRQLLEALGVPWVIENVPGARKDMIDPITLCGATFPYLLVYRHRLFETSFPVLEPVHQRHAWHQPKMGRPVKPGDYIQVVGNFSNADYAREAMGICWMGRDQLKEAIPPAYTHYIAGFVVQSKLSPTEGAP